MCCRSLPILRICCRSLAILWLCCRSLPMIGKKENEEEEEVQRVVMAWCPHLASSISPLCQQMSAWFATSNLSALYHSTQLENSKCLNATTQLNPGSCVCSSLNLSCGIFSGKSWAPLELSSLQNCLKEKTAAQVLSSAARNWKPV